MKGIPATVSFQITRRNYFMKSLESKATGQAGNHDQNMSESVNGFTDASIFSLYCYA
jgi:hypothetical protein